MTNSNTQKLLAEKLGELLLKEGFTKRGAAYFRVIGDGILQVAKFYYEPHGSYHSLNIGLHSMYENIDPERFTSAWCHIIFPIMRLVGKNSAYLFEKTPEIKNGYRTVIVSTDEQLKVMQEFGISFLNSILTQQQLLDAIVRLELAGVRHILDMNNFQKISPYLRLGEYEKAQEILENLLRVGVVYKREEFPIDGSDEEYVQLRNSAPSYYVERLDLLRMVVLRDYAAINTYLEENYQRNIKLAKFCMKEKTKPKSHH